MTAEHPSLTVLQLPISPGEIPLLVRWAPDQSAGGQTDLDPVRREAGIRAVAVAAGFPRDRVAPLIAEPKSNMEGFDEGRVLAFPTSGSRGHDEVSAPLNMSVPPPPPSSAGKAITCSRLAGSKATSSARVSAGTPVKNSPRSSLCSISSTGRHATSALASKVDSPLWHDPHRQPPDPPPLSILGLKREVGRARGEDLGSRPLRLGEEPLQVQTRVVLRRFVLSRHSQKPQSPQLPRIGTIADLFAASPGDADRGRV